MLDPPGGGLIREGGLFTKSSNKDIFGSFSVLLSHILGNQHTIFRLFESERRGFLDCVHTMPAVFENGEKFDG